MRTSTLVALSFAFAIMLNAQTDPGPRGGRGPGGPAPAGPPLSGQPIQALSGAEMQAFAAGQQAFNKISNVKDGLGPRFNLDSCTGCHAIPAPGGSSPPQNPQLPVAAKFGAAYQIPPFIQPNGPVRAVRFRQQADGIPDGSVHELFVITGRSDAPAGCQIQQPDFSNTANLAFRIPTPIFGLGLIESVSDSALRANFAAISSRKAPLGIHGHFNTSANDGTITRFGWKAQDKSLLMFSGEAFNVEMGVTNDLFPQEREEDPSCATNPLPEDAPAPGTPSDIEAASAFMRYLAPPTPSPATTSTANGATLFAAVGCALCHTPSLRTGNQGVAALSQQTINPYSDFALHRMGQGLADGITQGAAQGDEWRTAPLWGLGDRIFLLHDGRTQDSLQAIRLHDSPGSEAHGVVLNFNALTPSQQQDILNFLRSL